MSVTIASDERSFSKLKTIKKTVWGLQWVSELEEIKQYYNNLNRRDVMKRY